MRPRDYEENRPKDVQPKSRLTQNYPFSKLNARQKIARNGQSFTNLSVKLSKTISTETFNILVIFTFHDQFLYLRLHHKFDFAIKID